jgi:hypothetical protein
MEGKKTTARPSRRTASARVAPAAPRKEKAKVAAAKPGRARPGAAASPAGFDRLRMVEMAAYFRAERRGFEPGHEVEDWIAAEAEIDALFQAAPQKKPATRARKASSS